MNPQVTDIPVMKAFKGKLMRWAQGTDRKELVYFANGPCGVACVSES